MVTVEDLVTRGISLICYEDQDWAFDGAFRIELAKSPRDPDQTCLVASGSSYADALADLSTMPVSTLDKIGEPWRGPVEGVTI